MKANRSKATIDPLRLPKNWRMVELREVADRCLGKMLDAKKNKGRPHPYLRNPNVKWFHVDLRDLQEMPFEDHELDRFGVQQGDILICEGGEAGRAAIWEDSRTDVKIQKAIHRVRPTSELYNRYFVHRLMFDYFSGRLRDYYTGTTIKHFTGQDLAGYKFPLPPLVEQRRIAEVLDRAEALRAKRRAAVAQLDSLTQSLFLDLFGDPVKNPHNFPVRPMIELIDPNRPISYGILMPGPDQDEGVKYVRVTDMKNGGIDLSGIRQTTEAMSNSFRRSLLKPGDLLMSIRGHVGRFAVIPPELDGANITQDSARLAIVGASSVFVRECLRAEGFQKWMAKHTKGVAVRGINLGDVKLMPIILPPRPAQDDFARTADAEDGTLRVAGGAGRALRHPPAPRLSGGL